MIIIPAEQTLDWRNPPVATLTLILINCLIFFAYQSEDDKRYVEAASYYVNSGLLNSEAPLYLDFIEENHGSGERLNLIAYVEEYSLNALSHIVVNDIEFSAHLKALGQQPNGNYIWSEERDTFTQLQRSLSYFAYGFIPAEFSLQGFFGNMFLHGSLDHLLGNMLFLFICGFALEIAFGRVWYVSLYLLSGCLSTGFSYLTNMGGYIPGVGASGAISGLMGMYVALYSMRQIQFFYWVLIFFGYFTAPALLIFPVWVAKELYGYFYNDTNVNYMAHLGGLLSGFMAVYLVKDRFVQVDEAYVEKALTEDELLSLRLEEMWNLTGKLRFEKAWSMGLAILKTEPANQQLLQQLYNLAKAKPEDVRFHKLMRRIIGVPAPNVEFEHFKLILLEDYLQSSQLPRALTGDSCVDMVSPACKFQYVDLAYLLAQFLMNVSRGHEPSKNVSKALLRVLMTQLKSHKAERINEILLFLEESDAESEEYEMAKESVLLANR
tara:strand:+ start:2358 stop:3839 length:1482 start_codon:yes stop_codon:yes gene_type:complete